MTAHADRRASTIAACGLQASPASDTGLLTITARIFSVYAIRARAFGIAVFACMAALAVCPSALAGQNVLYVDDDAEAGGNGLSWATALDDLRVALVHILNSQSGGWEVRVAQGLYKPAPPGGSRNDSFDFWYGGTTLRGGYAGIGANDPDAWDPDLYETILSGDLNGDDGANFANNDENSFHVVRADLTDQHPNNFVLEGFTITGGNANGDPSEVFLSNHGGGLIVVQATPTVRRCKFVGNWGAIGGGIFVFASGFQTVVEDCLLLENAAAFGGGASLENQPAFVRRCRFIGNHADFGGGGLEYYQGTLCTVESCLFAGNTAGHAAGLIADGGDVLVLNSTFYSNHAEYEGGAAGPLGAVLEIRSSVVWANSGMTGFDEIGALEPNFGDLVVEYSTVQGWTGDLGGVGNSGDDPLFVDAFGSDGVEGTLDDDLQLLPESSAIDTGDPAVVPEPNVSDLDGFPRVLCGTVDRGAYESGIGDFNCDGALTIEDFTEWASCVTGPVTTGFDQACLSFDFDNDQKIDLRDYAKFAATLSVR